jgi:predicted TIM-barrel fold metal-dependent hydrolase
MQLPAAIVDSHHHLWDLSPRSPVRYPWLREAYDPAPFILGDYAPLCQDFGPGEFRAAWCGQPVVASVHVEAECHRADALAETRWLHDVHAAHGLPQAVVAWVDLLGADADERLHELVAWPLVRAVRFKPVTSRAPDQSVAGAPGALDDARWPAALARLQRHGFAWDLRVPFWHLEEAAALLRELPALPVVLEHTGLPWDRSAAGLAAWRRGMHSLAACPNVHVKLSEFGLRDAPWSGADNSIVIRDAEAIFGWQRCMFGSNFPVASLRVDYPTLVHTVAAALAHLDAPASRAVWHDNALRFYGIGVIRVA